MARKKNYYQGGYRTQEERDKFFAGFQPLTPSKIDRRPPQPGDTVLLKGTHPHAGKQGTVRGIEQTAIGPGYRIDIAHEEGAFVFEPDHISIVERAVVAQGGSVEVKIG